MPYLTPSERRRFLSLKCSPLEAFCQKHGFAEAHGTFIVDDTDNINDPSPCESWRVLAVNDKTVTAIIGG